MFPYNELMTFFKSKTGFSLIEVVVAMGVLSIGALFLMQMQTQQAKSAATTKANIEIESLVADLRGLLTRSEYCVPSFSNLSLPDGGEVSVPDIRNLQGKIKYAVGQVYGDRTIRIKSIVIKNFEADSPPVLTGVGKLELTIERAKNAYGAKDVKRMIDVTLMLDSARKIIGCQTLAAGGSEMSGSITNQKIDTKVVSKVLEDKAPETKEEEIAMRETAETIEKNLQMKEAVQALKDLKKAQEEMVKKQEEMEDQ